MRALLDGDAPFALATLVDTQSDAGRAGDTIVIGARGLLVGALRDQGPETAALQAEVVRLASAALASGRARFDTLGARRLFTDVLLPPPKLLVCGAGDDARPTVALAAMMGFRVSVADHRSAYLTAERFPEAQRLFLIRPEEDAPGLPGDTDTYAVIKTHSLMRDTAWVKRLAATEIHYLGVLGPRARIEKIAAELGLQGDPRLFGPIGVDIGADGPEQVGLSIVAELLAVHAHRKPRHLRERMESIRCRNRAFSGFDGRGGAGRRLVDAHGREQALAAAWRRDRGSPRRAHGRGSGADPIIVVLGHEPERVRAALAGLPCRTVVNPDHLSGKGRRCSSGSPRSRRRRRRAPRW